MRALAAVVCALLPCLCCGAVPDGWFPFVISELDESSVANVASYNRPIAGEDQRLRILEGRFVDGLGQRVRVLATNLTFQDAFPPKDQAPLIARRMAALGINCVRFHHMDAHFRPRGIWDPAFKDRQHLDSEQLDRLDWLIYQLKLNGIYSNLNLHVSRQFTEADGFVNPGALPKYNKGVDNFQQRMIELQWQYARDLLTHTNPYTKLPYTDDPCIAMVELNNENSLLRFALGSELHDLPEPYIGELKALWTSWLRDKYVTTGQLRIAWDEGSKPLGAQMLRNADFARGTEEWVLESKHKESDVFEIMDDPQQGQVLHARLNELGVNSWDFQIHQTGHTLVDGETYTVSFRIKADPPRTVSLGARYDIPDWRSVGLSASIKADTEWREHSVTFTAKEPKPEHTRVSFNCQNALGSVWLADVKLRPGGIRGLAEGQSLEDGTVEFSRSNSTAVAWRDWIEFAMELERRYTRDFDGFLKTELKLAAPVIDSQASYGGMGGVLRESRLDFIDIHAYWQHPRFPGRPWDPVNWSIPNTPMTAALGSDTLTRLAMHRVAGMAFTVSEYNHPAPGDYRAECMPMLASFAALQDWDGIFEFNYGAQPEDWASAKIGSYFTMVADPAKLAFFPVAANLFRRGDVEPARRLVTLRVPEAEVSQLVAAHGDDATRAWLQAGVPRKAAARHRLAIEFTNDGELTADRVNLPAEGCVTSDTSQINWMNPEQGPDSYWVETPGTRVVLGRLAGSGVAFEDGLELDFGETETGWVAAALTSMDDAPLSRSTRMLLVVMSKVENQDMEWDENRTTVGRKWGNGPTIAEGVGAKLTIPGREGLVAYALDGSGARGQRIGQENGGFEFGPQHQTLWYEITSAER